ncbi:hypothetical protein MHU86_18728 [Fragilaria crotonensis]|nr:hypothetical protein MHU86_18728 [Fragilaria crotonensis]
MLLDHHVQVSISNSTTTSGRIVTAGYILFKAARTTHRHRYLQSLRQQLPAETPFFDILLFHKTPMEQKINHLVIQCGENHVSPLSQALSEVLTGRNSPLYLSRIALAKLQPSQISAYFEMQDIYAKSLKSFPFFPTLINLDKVRKEIYDDGTVIERSTREWASSVFKDTDDIEARCEVVNGGFDQKAYLLTPFKYSTFVSEQFRQYRLRINPIGRREARFRDSLPGLPSVIHIDTSTQRNLDLLETMLSKEMWQKAPPSVRGLDQHTVTEEPVRKLVSNRRSHLSTAVVNQHPGFREGTAKKLSANVETPSPLDMSHDDQTAQTHSATQSLTTPSMLSSATSRRLNELEELFRRQRDDNVQNAEISSKNATKLAQIEAKLDASMQWIIFSTTIVKNWL